MPDSVQRKTRTHGETKEPRGNRRISHVAGGTRSIAAKRSPTMKGYPRRVGTETSKTRGLLLDCTEQLMLEDGYAAVTYRRVAAKSGVTAGLVQYYFPTLDDLFIALLQRRSARNLERLAEDLDAHVEGPLRAIWEHSRDETTAALMMEFMALGNHRKAIRAEITAVSELSKKAQVDALAQLSEKCRIEGKLVAPTAMLFLLAGIPKLMLMESELGISTGHKEILALVDHCLSRIERREAGRSGNRRIGTTSRTPS